MAKSGRKILKVKVRLEPDPDPDLSYLGEYTDTPGDDDKTVDRGTTNPREYRYFVAAMSGKDTGNPKSVRQDFDRMEDYNQGGWGMVGIWVEAEVQLHKGGVIQRVRSGGLWGIESDSGSTYFAEVADEELDTLRDELTAMGFAKRAIDKAFKEADTSDIA